MSKAIEQQLLIEVSTLLKDPAILGLKDHLKSDQVKEDEKTTQYNYEDINNQFALDTSDLVHADEILQAFRNAHNYKMADSEKFYESFSRSLNHVPADEKAKAMEAFEKVCKKFKIGTWDNRKREHDYGWNPRLDEIAKMTREGK